MARRGAHGRAGRRAAGKRGRQRRGRRRRGSGSAGRDQQSPRGEMKHARRAQPRQHRAIGGDDHAGGGAIGRHGQRLTQPRTGRLRGEATRSLQPREDPRAPGGVVVIEHVEVEEPLAGIVDDVKRHPARRRGGGLQDQTHPARGARRFRPGGRIGDEPGEILHIGEGRYAGQRLDASAPPGRAERAGEKRQRGGVCSAMAQRMDQAGREDGLAGARQAGDGDPQVIAAERRLGGAARRPGPRTDPAGGAAQVIHDGEGTGHRAARAAAQPAGASRGSRRRPRASRLARYSAQIRSRSSPSSRRYCHEKIPVSWRSSKRIRMA